MVSYFHVVPELCSINEFTSARIPVSIIHRFTSFRTLIEPKWEEKGKERGYLG